MAHADFVPLRVLSSYSLLEGAIDPKAIAKLAKERGFPAIAICDRNGLYGAVAFASACIAEGIQPIIGALVGVCRDGDAEQIDYLPLYAQDEAGYENLCHLVSEAHLARPLELDPHVPMSALEGHTDGLIALTGAREGAIERLLANGKQDEAEVLCEKLEELFPGRLYIEIARHRQVQEGDADAALIVLAYARNLPLIATNPANFADPHFHSAHDAMLCIANSTHIDAAERPRSNPEAFVKSVRMMEELFSDLPEATANTLVVAKRCAYAPPYRDPILPSLAGDLTGEAKALGDDARKGLEKRLEPYGKMSAEERKIYDDRLAFEVDVIVNMGFPGYFLIVADFIKWAKDNGIPVGPGRGSGAGSLVAWSLTITDLDPIKLGLLFERFLNPERVSMPDFDIDFCMDRREEVIRYVQGKYGRDKVGQIITFGALLSKAAVRDVGRVLQMPYGQVDRLSKMIPVEGVKPVSISQALTDEPRLREEARNEEVVKRLLDYGQQVEGLLRNASTHAAGVVIGDRPLDALVPLYRDPKSDMPATQFNMKWVEQAGLVKFDFLGLKTLTVIQNAVDLINLTRPIHVGPDGAELYEPAAGAENEINLIPLDDERSYTLYARAKTVAVFQVESTGMMDALRRMKPTCIEDIVALVALYRPGPMENIPKYCEVKNGISARDTLHPSVDHILDETQGIIVYQEQVMQIAQEMAGYSLGGADLLRRAMGKKIQAAMDAERPKFLAGAKANGVDETTAMDTWALLDKFANYGFNKSHAAAYAVVSYQTAWLKANHPVEFMAGVCNCDIHLTDKLAVYVEEARRGLSIEIVPPCVNRSVETFSVSEGRIVYGLGALKGVGLDVMRLVVEGRGKKQFATLYDMARRVDLKRVGKRAMEMMARAGAFDDLDPNRRRVFDSLDALVAYSAAVHEQKSSNQVSLFGEAGDDLPEPRLSPVDDWLPTERLAEEHTAIGFYLSGHPLDDYMASLRRKQVMTLEEVTARAAQGPFVAKMAGVVASRQERKSARGNRFAFIGLSDPTGLYEVTIFSDTLEASRDHLEPGTNVVVGVEVTMEAEQLKLLGRSIAPVDAAVADVGGSGLRVFVDGCEAVGLVASVLERAREDRKIKARGPVSLCLMDGALPGEVEVELGTDFPVTPQIKGALKSLGGVMTVEDY